MRLSGLFCVPLEVVMRSALLTIVCFCSPTFAQSIRFKDVSENTGIQFTHVDGGSGKSLLVETVCSGLALLDYDNDGWTDVFLLSGAPPPSSKTDMRPTSRLYRNLGGLRFVDVTDSAGVACEKHGLGVTCGDFDNDGDLDLYLSNFGPNVLFRNEGDGTFHALENAPRSNETRVGAGVSFFDIEGDGDLDLFVGNYIQFSYEIDSSRYRFGKLRPQGPKDFAPEADQLYRNEGDGSFKDISQESGISSLAAPTMGIIAFDYNRDGDTDVFVCNDSEANYLWDNDGHGRFTEIALPAGVAYDFKGSRQASMGVDCADVDRDGWLDLVATNFEDEIPNLYKNSRGEFFDDVGPTWGLGIATKTVKWGVSLSDFDNDGFADLFIASGALVPPESKNMSLKHAQSKPFVFRNNGGVRYAEASGIVEANLIAEKHGRAIGTDDLDNDGDLDVVILNINSTPTILCNESPSPHSHWVRLHLIGTDSNRDAVGSQVTIRSSTGEQFQEVIRGRGYQSQYGNALHFGLGEVGVIREIEVRWHGSHTEYFRNVPVDRTIRLVQGTGTHETP
jgi:enediyne biosynthesis protein E4